MVVKIKHGTERSQIFHFDSNEVRQHSERSQRLHCSFTYAKEVAFQWLVL